MNDLFKRPTVSSKRKLDAPKDPSELYKSAKLNGHANARDGLQASVQDEDEDAAGPELPPDLEEDVEDEEGRFFGGGVSRGTRDVLDFVDEQDEDAKIEVIDSTWLRKTALSFEKKISKNTELRAKFEGEPQKFMASEADLDANTKALSILTEHPELYGEFAKLGCVASLASLLSHENTDIAIDAVEVISELVDEDVEAETEQWEALVNALLEADLIDLLHANISRLNETQESDRNGVHKILDIIESLASSATMADKLSEHKRLIPWLLTRATMKETRVSQNTQYAAEVLSILLQSSKICREHFIKADGIDLFLQGLSAYRKRDPEKDTEEEEFVENLFDSLACVLDEPTGKAKFIEAEGIELCLIMVKEGKMSRPRALRLLDHAAGGATGVSVCEKIVEAAGLKPLFSAFMKSKQDTEVIEHLVGIFAAMLRSLPGETAVRIRLLGKFIEKDYEKITRLLQLRRDYASRLAVVDQDEDEPEELRLTKRLEAGLFSLQAVDTILAWLVAEDDGAKKKISSDLDLQRIRKTLDEQLREIEDSTEEERVSKDILTTLLSFLR